MARLQIRSIQIPWPVIPEDRYRSLVQRVILPCRAIRGLITYANRVIPPLPAEDPARMLQHPTKLIHLLTWALQRSRLPAKKTVKVKRQLVKHPTARQTRTFSEWVREWQTKQTKNLPNKAPSCSQANNRKKSERASMSRNESSSSTSTGKNRTSISTGSWDMPRIITNGRAQSSWMKMKQNSCSSWSEMLSSRKSACKLKTCSKCALQWSENATTRLNWFTRRFWPISSGELNTINCGYKTRTCTRGLSADSIQMQTRFSPWKTY